MAKVKTPLQDEKEKALDTILDKKAEEKEDETEKEVKKTEKDVKKTTPTKPKRKYTPRKKKEPPPPPDPEKLKQEGLFFVDLMSNGRASMGIDKPIPETTSVMFCNSYALLVIKHGEIATKWMPEVLMGLCLTMIGFDTWTEFKKLKPKKKKEAVKSEPEPEGEPEGVKPEGETVLDETKAETPYKKEPPPISL